MRLPSKIPFKEATYYVYKTGVPFYDAARVIGVAHLFLGTTSAEIKDKGACWEISGLKVQRDEHQVLWVIERLNPTQKERRLFFKKDTFLWRELTNFFSEEDITSRKGRLEELKAEYDVALQIGTRGVDPLSKYEILAPRSTGEPRKKFKAPYPEVAAATLGRAFAAYAVSRTKRQREEMYILPVFQGHFLLSSFLVYERYFSHASGGWVAAVWAALSILLDLTAKPLPIADFVYTREVKGPTNLPIFSDSGYLGLDKLCYYWWKTTIKNTKSKLDLLRNFRLFFQDKGASSRNADEKVKNLARWVAVFVANPNVEALTKIQQLKARILAASQGEFISGGYAANRLLGWSEHIKEVKAMLQIDLPEVPWQVSEALARALVFDEKGWMNQFTRLENAPNFSQFIRQVENIVSRGYYREQQEKGQQPNIQQALTKARDLANTLRGIESALRDEKAFRAWKAIFLLDVLSRARIRTKVSSEQTEGKETKIIEGG